MLVTLVLVLRSKARIPAPELYLNISDIFLIGLKDTFTNVRFVKYPNTCYYGLPLFTGCWKLLQKLDYAMYKFISKTGMESVSRDGSSSMGPIRSAWECRHAKSTCTFMNMTIACDHYLHQEFNTSLEDISNLKKKKRRQIAIRVCRGLWKRTDKQVNTHTDTSTERRVKAQIGSIQMNSHKWPAPGRGSASPCLASPMSGLSFLIRPVWCFSCERRWVTSQHRASYVCCMLRSLQEEASFLWNI